MSSVLDHIAEPVALDPSVNAVALGGEVTSSTADREKSSIFATYARLPIGVVTHAKGTRIYTEDGREYLDAVAGLGVNALGHSDEDVVRAIETQAKKYLHLSNLYLQEPQVALAERLCVLSQGLERVFFANSGTEAVEGAIKLSRRFFSDEAKAEVIGVTGGFHGRTYGPLSVMDKEKYRKGYGPFLPSTTTTKAFSAEAFTALISAKTAAVILEPIQGEGGIVECPPDVVDALHALRAKYGFLIIADEIQTGIGRTGSFFAYEQLGLKPDIVVAAKAVGGGLPLGVIMTSQRVAQAFAAGVHGTTFGGNALACAAGLVVLEKIERSVMQNAKEMGAYLRAGLESLQSKFPERISEVRGRGFMLGVDFKTGVKEVHEYLLQHGIITNVTADTVLRLLPPLIFSKSDCDTLLSGIETAILATNA